MSTEFQNQQLSQIFIRAIRLSYYLGKPNSAGVSVIYAQFRANGQQFRISTGLKIQQNHWNQRSHYAIVAAGMSALDIHNNLLVNQRLQEIDIAFIQKIEYFCNHYQDIAGMPEGLLSAIKPHYTMVTKKKKDKQTTPSRSATQLMLDYRLNHAKDGKERSYQTARTNILDFAKFLEESHIPDTLASMTKGIAAQYADWLKKRHISVNTANQRIRALATNLKNLTTMIELDFSYPLPEKLPLLTENMTGDEMEDNDIALTEQQVMSLYELTGLTDKEVIARDMFCLQCWTGVRVSDLPQLLDSKNLKDINGEPFSVFRPQKTQNSKNLRAHIPLKTIFPEAYTLVQKYLDKCPKLVIGTKNNYNDTIRAVCRIAGLNELRTQTKETGGKKTSEQKKLWELMTSHKGRHTFVSNCKKRGIPEDKIILMTAHASTVQIKQTYDNTDAEDKARLLSLGLSALNSNVPNSVPKTNGPHQFDPVEVLRRALMLLGEETQDKINLVELAQRLIGKKAEIIEKYGEQFYLKLKETIMIGTSPEAQQTLNLYLCKALRKPHGTIKISGLSASLKRLKW